MIALSGVRISWDIFARKELFALLAESAPFNCLSQFGRSICYFLFQASGTSFQLADRQGQAGQCDQSHTDQQTYGPP